MRSHRKNRAVAILRSVACYIVSRDIVGTRFGIVRHANLTRGMPRARLPLLHTGSKQHSFFHTAFKILFRQLGLIMAHAMADMPQILECEEQGLRAQIRALLDGRRPSASNTRTARQKGSRMISDAETSGGVDDLYVTGAAILDCADAALAMMRRLVPSTSNCATTDQSRSLASLPGGHPPDMSARAFAEPGIVGASDSPSIDPNGQTALPRPVARLHQRAFPQEQPETLEVSSSRMTGRFSVKAEKAEDSEWTSLPPVFSIPSRQAKNSTTPPRAS